MSKITFNVALEEETLRLLRESAKEQDLTVGHLIRRIIKEWMECKQNG